MFKVSYFSVQKEHSKDREDYEDNLIDCLKHVTFDCKQMIKKQPIKMLVNATDINKMKQETMVHAYCYEYYYRTSQGIQRTIIHAGREGNNLPH